MARLDFAVIGGIVHPRDVANRAIADLSTATRAGADFAVDVVIAKIDHVRIF